MLERNDGLSGDQKKARLVSNSREEEAVVVCLDVLRLTAFTLVTDLRRLVLAPARYACQDDRMRCLGWLFILRLSNFDDL